MNRLYSHNHALARREEQGCALRVQQTEDAARKLLGIEVSVSEGHCNCLEIQLNPKVDCGRHVLDFYRHWSLSRSYGGYHADL